MTGAGSGSLAWTPETEGYLEGTGADPVYREPGTNVQVGTSQLSRNLLEIVAPGDVETQKFLAQNLEGQLDVSWILKNDDFHRLVFNDEFTGFTSGLANSAEVYLGCDYIGGTTERQIMGWAPASCTIQYNGSAEAVRVSISGPYGDEKKNTAITPGTVERAGDEVPGFGTTLSLDGENVGDRLQTATLSFEQISRLVTGASQKPIEAVAGNVQQSVDMSAVYNGPDIYERALGSTGADTIQEDVDEVPGTLTFEAAGSTVAEYGFDAVAPDTYDWVDLLNNDANTNESVTLLATGITASDPTA